MLSAEIILLILIIITAKYRRQQQCPTHIIGVEPERERERVGREGKVLKGPQNTQILTVMRDSGSFSGQLQQMAFTREISREG